jgi:hypothetical protein
MVPFKKSKETPAEQLLRMIEGPQAATQAAAKPSTTPARRMSDAAAGVRLWLGRRLLPPHREVDAFLWNLRVAHRVLWLVLLALGAYVLADLILGAPTVSRRAVVAPADATAVEPEAERPLRALSEYLVAMKERNPFSGEAALSGAAKTQTARRRLQELAEGLVVVGIDRGANPMAIIEHAAQRRTFMLKVGEEVNGMKVVKIGADGVTVEYEGEQMVLP